MTDKNRPENIPATSMDLTEHNLEQLKALFPNVFTEGKVDFDALKAELGEHVEADGERYQFTWAGKEQAKRIATTPSLGTLRPAPEESVNWDNTENLYIEGDNLEVLKLLQKSYFNQVKMIYIDPPYNTGKDFVYKDDFKDNLANYQRLTGQRDEEGNPLFTNSDSAGRYHSNWLNMMYPRLKLARNLLRDDGVIFISIDDNEVHNLRKLCDEIFGDSNFITAIVWEGGRKNDSKRFSVVHDYILVYVKDNKYLTDEEVVWRERKSGIDEVYKKAAELRQKHGENYESASSELRDWFSNLADSNSAKEHSHYCKIDNSGVYYGDNISSPNYRENLIFEYKGYKPPRNGWRYNLEAMKRLDSEGLLIFPVSKDARIQYKRYLHHTETWAPTSLLYKDRRAASKSLISLFDGDYFDFPKDVDVLRKFSETFTGNEDVVLDFFSGSSTTAHAVMQLNAEDNGNRKFIMVQIPEPTPEKSEAQKAGYATIAEIGKERIRRAAAKIREEHPDTQADLGFKVLKLDSSNLKKWQPDYDNLKDDLLDAVDNIAPGRSSEDLLYEVLIKYGLPLTLPVAQQQVNGHTVYNVASGSLVACFDENINLDTVQAIIDLGSVDEPILRIVFRDSSFADDIVKTNAIQRFKQAGIEDVLSI